MNLSVHFKFYDGSGIKIRVFLRDNERNLSTLI